MKISRNRFASRSVFQKLLVIFNLLILVSITVVSMTSYAISAQALEEEALNNGTVRLGQTKSIVDQYTRNIDDIMMQFSRDVRVKEALYYEAIDTTRKIDQLYTIHQRLATVTQSNSFIQSVWIYLADSNQVVSSDLGSMPLDYLTTNVRDYGRLTYERWEEILNTPSLFRTVASLTVRENSQNRDVICFIKSLPPGTDDPLGAVVVEIDEGRFLNYVGEYGPEQETQILIYDDNNSYVVSGGRQILGSETVSEDFVPELPTAYTQTIDRERYFVVADRSVETGWTYVSITPNHAILGKIQAMRIYDGFVILVALLIGTFVSYILARSVYKPLRHMLDYLSLSKVRLQTNDGSRPVPLADGNEFEYLNYVVDNIFAENTQLNERLKKSLPALREKTLLDLLDGRVSIRDIREHMPLLELPSLEGKTQVGIVHTEAMARDGVNSARPLTDTLDRAVRSTTYRPLDTCYVIADMSTIVFVFSHAQESDDLELTYPFLKDLMTLLKTQHELPSVAAIGMVYSDDTAISRSYADAKLALRHRSAVVSNEILDIQEVLLLEDAYVHYRLETERKLINFVRSGDRKDALELLESIYNENMTENGTTEKMTRLCNSLMSTLTRILNDLGESSHILGRAPYELHCSLDEFDDIQEKMIRITSLYETVVEFVSTNKRTRYDELYIKVTEYIDENYAQGLSLKGISRQFGFSPSYISWIFSEAGETNFLDYVNRLRIRTAKELMNENTSMSLAAVAKAVGIYSSNTFIRVFKKYEGITPGVFRKSHR